MLTTTDIPTKTLYTGDVSLYYIGEVIDTGDSFREIIGIQCVGQDPPRYLVTYKEYPVYHSEFTTYLTSGYAELIY